MPHGGRLSKNADCTQRQRHQDDAGKRRVYPPGQQNDRGKRWHCKEIQQLGGTQGTVPCVLPWGHLGKKRPELTNEVIEWLIENNWAVPGGD